jgi:hypothetical protein
VFDSAPRNVPDIDSFVREVKEILTPTLLEEEGYSKSDTLVPGDLYVLGLSSGGKPGEPGKQSI